ncbi:MAG: sugar phosphate isomerase/epimerase [Marinilabiliales bacterium]|nr:MAG: sugar phosphate isomerase/epimerase [Marinilabiliales bacterium]
MAQDSEKDLSRLCVHTITTRPLDLETAVAKYASRGIQGITVWRDALQVTGAKRAGRIIREGGLDLVSLCRGGFFPSIDPAKRRSSITDNLAALEEAHDAGAPLLVLVCGADPGQSPGTSREQIKAGIEAILPRAAELGVRLAIEPLHPVYADTRSSINTMKQAIDMARYFDSSWLGVAVDVYHVWWDEELETAIDACGRDGRLFAFHICDWKVPTGDILNDRGLMGEGCIDIRRIRGWMERSGFEGYNEVEIFSDIYWNHDQNQFLDMIVRAYLDHS